MEKFYDKAIVAAIEAGEAILNIYQSDDFKVTKKEDNSPLTRADSAAHKVIISHLQQSGIPVLSEEGRDIPYTERKEWDTFWMVDPLDGTKEFIKQNGEFTVNIALIKAGKPVFGVVYAPVLKNLFTGIKGEGAWWVEGPFENFTMNTVRKNGFPLPVAKSLAGQVYQDSYKVVASRSHLNSDTEGFLDQIRAERDNVEIVSKGSSLKLCMVATGEADIYPRLGPTMEWDVAAAHAVVSGAGRHVYKLKKEENEGGKWEKDGELNYNKENLLNPYFLVV